MNNINKNEINSRCWRFSVNERKVVGNAVPKRLSENKRGNRNGDGGDLEKIAKRRHRKKLNEGEKKREAGTRGSGGGGSDSGKLTKMYFISVLLI